ncbi:MAG: ribose-phosphate pyrophosphokinase [Chloroflexota bacterium]|nr:ribose-phosphate pyrophosphokinase [Chloroflexota bacterium]
MAIYSGTAHRRLAQGVSDYVDIPLGGRDVFQFSNTNTFCRLHESVRGKDVFLIQPTCPPVNENLMELLIFLDTLCRDSAGRITAIVPYYGYGRTDKKDQPRVPITARLVADLITVAGADRFLTLDLHAGQIQGFFTIPTDELPTVDLFIRYFKKMKWTPDDMAVVSPDIGGVGRARDFAERLALPLAIIEKRRTRKDGKKTKMFNVIGDVAGKNVLIVDDEIDTAGTLCKAARFLREAGARKLYASATHAILSKPAAKRIEKTGFTQIVVTDTVPIEEKKRRRIGNKLKVLSVAPLLGDVILRIHEGRSVGELFDE